LLDSSLPHDLIQDYHHNQLSIPRTILEEPLSPTDVGNMSKSPENGLLTAPTAKLKRTPRDLYRVPNERSPLLPQEDAEEQQEPPPVVATLPGYDFSDEDVESGDSIVTVAIYVNLVANAVLLAAKIGVIILTSSLSVLASLVDAALDFLSTAIVWTVTRLIAQSDNHAYPVGRRRLEPIGVLVFSIVMITAFCQVMLECFQRLIGPDHSIVQLTRSSIIIMASTVVIKFVVWLWCRLIKNSSVQALAQDAMTDVVFNTFSIVFPLGKHTRSASDPNPNLSALLKIKQKSVSTSASGGSTP
jgi:Cation efflux family